MQRTKRTKKFILFLVISIATIIFLFPIYWVIITAFKNRGMIYTLPPIFFPAGFTFDNFVEAFPNRILNVHPALLPSFGGKGYYGLHVHEAVLARGVKVTGATVHFVNEVCDGGPIILQKAVEVRQGDTPELLQKRVMEEAEWSLLPKAVSLFCEGRLSVKDGIVELKETEED